MSPEELLRLADAAEGGEPFRGSYGNGKDLQKWKAVPANDARRLARIELSKLGFNGMDEGHNSGIALARRVARVAMAARAAEKELGCIECREMDPHEGCVKQALRQALDHEKGDEAP